MHIITPLCYTSIERLGYFKKYIDHVNLLNNLDKIKFLFFVEPNSENMIDMIPKHWNTTIFKNYYRFKPELNHFVSFKYCFDILNVDYAFLLEDDIICSPDLYNLSDYCIKNGLLEDALLCTLNKHELYEPNDQLYKTRDNTLLLKLTGKRYVSCWGTGISKSFWKRYMFKQWRMDITFDASIDLQYEYCKVVSPVVSRSNQIGKIGLNYTSDLWDSHNFNSINICDTKNEILYKTMNIHHREQIEI